MLMFWKNAWKENTYFDINKKMQKDVNLCYLTTA